MYVFNNLVKNLHHKILKTMEIATPPKSCCILFGSMQCRRHFLTLFFSVFRRTNQGENWAWQSQGQPPWAAADHKCPAEKARQQKRGGHTRRNGGPEVPCFGALPTLPDPAGQRRGPTVARWRCTVVTPKDPLLDVFLTNPGREKTIIFRVKKKHLWGFGAFYRV